MITINDDTKKILAEKQNYFNNILNRKGMRIRIEASKILSSNGKENVINITILKTNKELKDLSQLEYCNLDKTCALVHLTGKKDEPLSEKYEVSSLGNEIEEIGNFIDCKVDTIDDIFKLIENIIKKL